MEPYQTLSPMLEVEDALARFLSHFCPLEPEQVPILDALDRVLGEDVIADMDIPPIANTAMDGYAVRCQDTGGARPDVPRRLRVIADLAAGSVMQQPIQPGTAVRIMTGAPIPSEGEAVIPFEEVAVDGEHILVYKRYPHGFNIRHAGEDVRKNEVVIGKGSVLRPQEIGMLAALGYTHIHVVRRPRVALLSTGNEVIEPGAEWQPGKIRDANRFSNAAQVRKYGGIPIPLGIARDTVEEISGKIKAGLDQGIDLLITSGGVSVGDFDLVKKVLAAEGKIAFWRVRMKPGKPLAFGLIRGIPLLGLPGNPVSAMMSFEIFARPAILMMLGKANLKKPEVDAILLDEIQHKDDRRHYVRTTIEELDGNRYVRLTGDQGSGILFSMVKADALAIIPEDVDHLSPNSPVKIILLD